MIYVPPLAIISRRSTALSKMFYAQFFVQSLVSIHEKLLKTVSLLPPISFSGIMRILERSRTNLVVVLRDRLD
jgi:hypothetical protein